MQKRPPFAGRGVRGTAQPNLRGTNGARSGERTIEQVKRCRLHRPVHRKRPAVGQNQLTRSGHLQLSLKFGTRTRLPAQNAAAEYRIRLEPQRGAVRQKQQIRRELIGQADCLGTGHRQPSGPIHRDRSRRTVLIQNHTHIACCFDNHRIAAVRYNAACPQPVVGVAPEVVLAAAAPVEYGIHRLLPAHRKLRPVHGAGRSSLVLSTHTPVGLCEGLRERITAGGRSGQNLARQNIPFVILHAERIGMIRVHPELQIERPGLQKGGHIGDTKLIHQIAETVSAVIFQIDPRLHDIIRHRTGAADQHAVGGQPGIHRAVGGKEKGRHAGTAFHIKTGQLSAHHVIQLREVQRRWLTGVKITPNRIRPPERHRDLQFPVRFLHGHIGIFTPALPVRGNEAIGEIIKHQHIIRPKLLGADFREFIIGDTATVGIRRRLILQSDEVAIGIHDGHPLPIVAPFQGAADVCKSQRLLLRIRRRQGV